MKIENKISKICWNTKNWKFPSGSKGKSPSSSSYESKYGYGHEEWLFDRSRIIDGFHYAFLQPLNLKSDRHVDKIYIISLFTVYNSARYFVGEIKNAVCISKEASKQIYKIYKKKGWIKEMASELQSAGADPAPLKTTLPEIFFNLTFQFKNVELTSSGDLEEISENDPNITTNRYKLLPYVNKFVLAAEVSKHQGNLKSIQKRKRKVISDISFDPIHDKIQNALCSILRSNYSDLYKKVDIETGRVDLKALTNDGKWHFYEIKTDNAKLSIRKGIGQLIEYSYFPENNVAEKLIVVSDSAITSDTKNYLNHIRTTFSLPIYYRQFDLEKSELSVEY